MSEFEKWFKDQDFYTNMRFIHGDKLFDKDGDVYRVLPVQMTYLAWSEQRQRSKDEFVALTQEWHTKGWNARQGEIEKLENELSTTKQVLGNVIDMEVAKVDNLKAQLNNMEACYIQVKKERDELEAAKRDYVCDCGYLDSPDYEECDCRKHSEDLANEAIAEIVKKANFAGLEELLDELKCRAIKHGVLLNKQALRGAND